MIYLREKAVSTMVYYRLNGFQPPNIGYAPNATLQTAPPQPINGLTSPVNGLTSPVNGLTLGALSGLHAHAAGANTGPGLLPPPPPPHPRHTGPGTGNVAAAAAAMPHQQFSYLQKYVVSHLTASQINYMVSTWNMYMEVWRPLRCMMCMM